MAISLISVGHMVVRAANDADCTTMITDGAVFQTEGVIDGVSPYCDLDGSPCSRRGNRRYFQGWHAGKSATHYGYNSGG